MADSLTPEQRAQIEKIIARSSGLAMELAADVRQLFTLMDSNQNGKIDKDEEANLKLPNGEKIEIKEGTGPKDILTKAVDSLNRTNGGQQFQEFPVAMLQERSEGIIAVNTPNSESAIKAKQALESIKSCDKDGNGIFTLQEAAEHAYNLQGIFAQQKKNEPAPVPAK